MIVLCIHWPTSELQGSTVVPISPVSSICNSVFIDIAVHYLCVYRVAIMCYSIKNFSHAFTVFVLVAHSNIFIEIYFRDIMNVCCLKSWYTVLVYCHAYIRG